MAVELEFISLVIRKDAIEARYPGGWARFQADHERVIGAVCWYDSHLFRTGAMNPSDMQWLVENYVSSGLKLYREELGEPVEWLDGCVVEWAGPTLPCDWIRFTDAGAAYLAGTSPGEPIGRRNSE